MTVAFVPPGATAARVGSVFGTNRAGPGVKYNEPIQVLLVDIDLMIQRCLVDYLEDSGMDISIASNVTSALHGLDPLNLHLVLLALRQERRESLDLLPTFRSRSIISGIIVMLLETKGNCETDRVAALDLGADDCITEPFSRRELLARIRVILRHRKVGLATSLCVSWPRGCRFGGWELNHCTRQLTSPIGCQVALSRADYALLVAFLDAPQRALTREHLINATGMHEDRFDRSIDVRVLRLRRKLTAASETAQLIRTERGVGYILNASVEAL